MSEVPELPYKKFWLLIGYFFVATVFYLSLMPDPPKIETSITFFDKINHFTAYFFLTVWFSQIYYLAHQRRLFLLLFILMGITIEVLQSFEVTRMFEWLDMLANTVGAVLAYYVTRGEMKFLLGRLLMKLQL